MSIVVSAGGETDYVASNMREGVGGYDLHTFEMPRKARPAFVSYIKGNVYDAATKTPLHSSIQLVDLSTRELVFGSETNELTGSFLRSEEHTSELQSLMRISYAVFCLNNKNNTYR